MAKNFLEIENVTFAASEKNKVNNVSLTIENEGDIICLLGPSGIGKTTILRAIAGLEKIQSGTILLKNKIISSKNVHIEPENRNISLAFQDNSLFPHYNVIQNIQFGADRNKKKKKDLTIDEVIKFLEKLLVYKEKLGVFDEYETQSWNFRHQTRRPGICKSMSCVCHNKSYLILLNFRIFKYYIHNIYLDFFFNLQN